MVEPDKKRIVASFTSAQLQDVKDWMVSLPRGLTKPEAERLIAEKAPDEKGRQRLELSMNVLVYLSNNKINLRSLREAMVWQTEEIPPKKLIEYRTFKVRHF